MPKPRDIGNEETEELLKRLEKRLKKEYEQATKEVEDKFKDYMRRFEIKDEIKRKAVEAGVLKESDYKKWRQSQIFNGERWEAMLNDLSQDLKNVSDIAISTARGYQAEAYAINHNFATYLIERDSKINTSYTLFDRQTVERLMREDPKLLPDPKPGGKTARKLAENKELRWNRQHITSAVMQGVVQGETVPQMAKRLESVGEMDHRAAIRNARTMVTGAQNAGRINASKRASDMGIGLTNVWMATLDMRTRHEHRVLDGQRRDVGEPFVVEGLKIRFPGDPEAKPWLVYNCRCTLIPQIKGFEYDIRGDARMDYSDIEGMTYDEWKKNRVEKPNPITLPEEKAEAIKQSYIAEYRKLSRGNGNVQNAVQQTTNSTQKLMYFSQGKNYSVNDLTVSTVKGFGFGDGANGIRKNADATVYKTPDGLEIIFPKVYNKNHQTVTVDLILDAYCKVPVEIRTKGQKRIVVHDVYNPMDSYWQKQYKNFTHSYATGGETLNFWRYDYQYSQYAKDNLVNKITHEMAHLIDWQGKYRIGPRFSEGQEWADAMKADFAVSRMKSPTEYGENSKLEDFAEAFAELVVRRNDFIKNFPNRYALISKILSS